MNDWQNKFTELCEKHCKDSIGEFMAELLLAGSITREAQNFATALFLAKDELLWAVHIRAEAAKTWEELEEVE